MVTSKDILRATGLKSVKTLTRWHQQGVIPAPDIRTHPSGRGKIACWPDWVLKRCEQIAALAKQGHSPRSASAMLSSESARHFLDDLASRPVRTLGSESPALADVFIWIVSQSAKRILPNDVLIQFIRPMRNAGAFQIAMQLAAQGHNPMAVFDGAQVEIVPDFQVSYMLSDQEVQQQRPFFVVPLLGAVHKLLMDLKRDWKPQRRYFPAPKIWKDHGDEIIEVAVHCEAPGIFELMEWTATKVVGNDLFAAGPKELIRSGRVRWAGTPAEPSPPEAETGG